MKNNFRLNPELFLTSRRTLARKPSGRFLLMASMTIILSACGGGGDGTGGELPEGTDTAVELIENLEQEISTGTADAESTTENTPAETELTLGQAVELATEFDSQLTTGFTALILDDGSVELNWVPAAFAESYQIYRNEQLVAETTKPVIVDKATVMGDNVYRIVALDDGSQPETIANGLNVEVTNELIAAIPALAAAETVDPVIAEPAVTEPESAEQSSENVESPETTDAEAATETIVVVPTPAESESTEVETATDASTESAPEPAAVVQPAPAEATTALEAPVAENEIITPEVPAVATTQTPTESQTESQPETETTATEEIAGPVDTVAEETIETNIEEAPAASVVVVLPPEVTESGEPETIETQTPQAPATNEAEPVAETTAEPLVIAPDTDAAGTDQEQSEAAAQAEADAAAQAEADAAAQAEAEAAAQAEADAAAQAEAEAAAQAEAEAAAQAEADAAAQAEAAGGGLTFFSSHSTEGFSGQVQDDGSVVLRWNAEPGAEGYNVYRDSQYLLTVFEPTHHDTDASKDSHYYYVQSFDDVPNFTDIANGLTVDRVGGTAWDVGRTPDEILGDYEMVFSDEFDGSALDTSKWNTSYLWGPDLVINSEEQYYVDVRNEPDFGYNPFTVDNGVLTIQSIETPIELSGKANGAKYLSGVITSYDAFKFTYGYVEARAKLPRGRGFWAAFWLLNAYYVERKPEIDIMEHIGHDWDWAYHTYHYFDSEGTLHSTHSEATVGVDYTNDFHTFGVEWRPGKIVYYVDGVATHTVSDPAVSAQEMYILANTAIGGWWPGSPDSNTKFPGTYEIDYIRAYQKPGPTPSAPLDDGIRTIPFADDVPNRSANHIPSPEQWPEGYPELGL